MSHVQSAKNAVDAANNAIACTFGAAVTSGSLVRGFVSWGTDVTTDLTSVTDDQGNTYTIVDRSLSSSGDGQCLASFYKANITNAPTVITANFGSSISFRAIVAGEESGLDTTSPLDGNTITIKTSPGTGTDLLATTNITTTVDGDLICSGVVCTVDGTVGAIAVGTGFTIREAETSATLQIKSEDTTQVTHGAVAGTWTDSTRGNTFRYIVAVMAFKPGVTPPPPTVNNPPGRRLIGWQENYA